MVTFKTLVALHISYGIYMYMYANKQRMGQINVKAIETHENETHTREKNSRYEYKMNSHKNQIAQKKIAKTIELFKRP